MSGMKPGKIIFLAGIVYCLAGVKSVWSGEPMPSAEHIPLSNSKAMVYSPGVVASPDGPLALNAGPHFFLDEYLIAQSENIERVVCVPQRDPGLSNPIVTGKEDGCFQPYMTILRDPKTGRYRLWYGHRVDDNSTSVSHIGYMESGDAIHWQRPVRILNDPAPIQFGVSVIDRGPDFPNAAQRYHFAWWRDGGMKVAVSPDGFAWTPLSAAPVLPANHDITGIFWDPIRKRIMATLSVYRTGEAWTGQRRVTLQSHSDDLLHWETPHYVVTPDVNDPGETQFYAMDGYLARGDLMIGMVKVLRDDLKADTPPDPPDAYGVGYTALAWSRDGETWYRDRAHFFDPDPKKGAWDHAHAWIDEQLPMGDEVYLYYGGYARGHKVNRFEERQIGVLTMPCDRYVARAAGNTPGKIVTPLLLLDGNKLTLNADASKGNIAIRLVDEQGNVIPGFAARKITGDGLRLAVPWEKSLKELHNRPVRIEFSLDKASLFTFALE